MPSNRVRVPKAPFSKVFADDVQMDSDGRPTRYRDSQGVKSGIDLFRCLHDLFMSCERYSWLRTIDCTVSAIYSVLFACNRFVWSYSCTLTRQLFIPRQRSLRPGPVPVLVSP